MPSLDDTPASAQKRAEVATGRDSGDRHADFAGVVGAEVIASRCEDDRRQLGGAGGRLQHEDLMGSGSGRWAAGDSGRTHRSVLEG